jgi:hypothetical protein
MTPAQYNEYQRQADVIEEEKKCLAELPQQEISDEEIFKQSVLAMEERYGSGCYEEIDAHFRGAVWYREQLKQL